MKTHSFSLSSHLAALCIAAVLLPSGSPAQSASEVETDPLVLKKLEWFKDQKFGFMMHWGPYSQWGIVESWSLCPEDEGWTQRRGPYAADYFTYKQAYEKLQTTFNPVRFNPESWAEAAQGAGMRYLVFTTKHHDGFCMFDTKQTSYRITDPGTPFHSNPRSNVAREIFAAFRAKGLGIGAYFSKPDWHSENYWWPYFPPKDRNVNYDITKYPDRWKAFQQFTFNQIEELMTEYGSIDILWLDGGWVNANNRGQDIDMSRIASMARMHQHGLIIVDRAVPGRFENYRTPEQQVPETPLDYPWETCMTMGNSWSYVPNDSYKPAHRLIHLLVDIVSKGGNFLLNVGPSPDGELPPVALERMKEVGAWMKVNGSAIYSTRPRAPYAEQEIRYTGLVDGTINAIYLARKEDDLLPSVVEIPSFCPVQGTTVRMLGLSTPLTWEARGKGCLVRIPDTTRKNPPCKSAWTFRFTPR